MRWLAWSMVCLFGVGTAFVSAEINGEEEALDGKTILSTTMDKEDYVNVAKCISRIKIRC